MLMSWNDVGLHAKQHVCILVNWEHLPGLSVGGWKVVVCMSPRCFRLMDVSEYCEANRVGADVCGLSF